MPDRPRVALLTREYPPEVYGGAGVHVEHLARSLADEVAVEVHAIGGPRDDALVAGTYRAWEELGGPERYRAALETFCADLAMVAGVDGVALVHSHTWYANLAGHFAKLVHGVPHVLTTHSLEPLRPWKREQLGGGYELSSFAERTAIEAADAVVAVSNGMRDDILTAYPSVDADRVEVIHNGVDLERYRPVESTAALGRHGVDPSRPYAVFVGRITRQKGVVHLLDAARHLPDDAQLVLCAGAPDTPEIAEEFRRRVAALEGRGPAVVWIEEMLPREEVIELLSHAQVFVCPSVYEPFGIVNLEAMACGSAVVASAVGGIPEIVVDDRTGYLVGFDAAPDGGPADPGEFARELGVAVSRLLTDEPLATRMGAAGRARAEERFGWGAVAARTAALYRKLLS